MECVVRSTFTLLLFALASKCQDILLDSSSALKNSTSLNITGVTNRTLNDGGIDFSCKWNFNFKMVQATVSGVFILSGLFVLSVGYRKRRAAFFLVGFIGSGILTYFVCVGESKFSTTILILISVAGGLLLSLFTTTVLYIGYFITGLFAGMALGFGVLLVYTEFQLFYSIAIPCVVIAGISLVLVFTTLWWRRVMLITSTSILGASMMAGGLDYFVEGLFILKYAEQKIFYSKVAPVCWYTYVVLSCWPTLVVAGMLVQLFWTGKEKHKTNYVFVYRRRKRNQEERIGLTTRDVDYRNVDYH